MTLTIGSVLHSAKNQLMHASITSYALDAELLLAHVTAQSRERIIGYPEHRLAKSTVEQYQQLITRRAAQEPVAHLTASKHFWQDEFIVSPDTLIPRPDSETLIEALLEHCPERHKKYRILELGTGSGCLLLSLLRSLPNATGLGSDINQHAIKIAQTNAQKLGLAKRVAFSVNNWALGLSGSFDIIVSNPPYIKEADIDNLDPEVKQYEPKLALSGGTDGLEHYRVLAATVKSLLARGGLLGLEHGAGQDHALQAIVTEKGWNIVTVKKDLNGIPRCLLANH